MADDPIELQFKDYPIRIHRRVDQDLARLLLPRLTEIVHQTFIDHPEFDRVVLPGYLKSSYSSVIRLEETVIGFVFANLTQVGSRPLLHLAGAYVLPGHQNHSLCQHVMVKAFLALAAEDLGREDFFVAVRTPNPVAVGAFWDLPHFQIFPRPEEFAPDDELARIRREFCRQTYGLDGWQEESGIIVDTYPVPPYHGRSPRHRDDRVNRFVDRLIAPGGRDALLMIGRTTPPLPRFGQGDWS